jgi:hypothetical protein
MLRLLKIALPVFLIGFLSGNAFWYLFSPLWIDQVVSEALPPELMVSLVREGSFQDADRAHQGAGNALLLETASGAHLVTNGPDLEVWLVEDPRPLSSGAVNASNWVSLGRLKGNIGDQTYQIPADVDVTRFGSVVIWCEQFGVLFAWAALEATQ